MDNVKCTVDTKTNKLIIEVDLSKNLGPSSSGKTLIIASSRGNSRIDGTEVYLGLNIYKKK